MLPGPNGRIGKEAEHFRFQEASVTLDHCRQRDAGPTAV